MKDLRHTIRPILTGIGRIVLAGFIFCPGTYGQGLYNQSALFIRGNVHVDGDLINSGKLDNEGHISITRDWESSGQYNGVGVVTVSGNNPQRIEHYNQGIHTLTIDGGGTKYIKGIVNITTLLNLNHGIVQVSAADQLKLAKDLTITGGSANSYVDGALLVEGTGYKFFPVGKNGTYAPIEFLDATGKELVYSMEVFENAPAISIDNVIVRDGVYWHRKDIAGQFNGSPVAIDFDPTYFRSSDKIVMVTGSDWEEPFLALTDVLKSSETDKISTQTIITTPIIMLGEISERWAEADFYFSTALSPNATRADNRKVKVFGDRLLSDQFHFQVFNRWGDMVYESYSLEDMVTNGWDGRAISGDELVGGAYPYRLTAVDKTGKQFEKKGFITILY